MCEDKKSCITINCGCCNSNSNDSTPVGTVISYMGTTAPKHYLICDGSVYNIDNYKEFSQFIKDEHGSFDFFGGDGITTFAVPDLRGEFLRGTGVGTRNTGTGANVGVHQNPTQIPEVRVAKLNSNTYIPQIFALQNSNPTGLANWPTEKDLDMTTEANTEYQTVGSTNMVSNWTGSYAYTTRPTNTAVLYCIKYE